MMQSPYLAQYGNFTAGLVSAETRRGGDKWAYDLNDSLPEFRIRSGHLVGVRSATPRFNLSAPLVHNRFYFLDGTDYLMHKDEVRTLPFPNDEIRSTALNSFTQFDILATSKQTITATFHLARTRCICQSKFFRSSACHSERRLSGVHGNTDASTGNRRRIAFECVSHYPDRHQCTASISGRDDAHSGRRLRPLLRGAEYRCYAHPGARDMESRPGSLAWSAFLSNGNTSGLCGRSGTTG